ncbi:GM18082 [Drosophila sechellia]|uniref:GM18082 n=1 Tax=Drosophila sechellia TaxID=7238 RepID=B4I3A9_DROSE|nr:GM18082 [Drosophila sechellia]
MEILFGLSGVVLVVPALGRKNPKFQVDSNLEVGGLEDQNLSLVAVVFLEVGRKESKIQENSNLERRVSREDLEFPMDSRLLVLLILEVELKMAVRVILEIGGKESKKKVGLSLGVRVEREVEQEEFDSWVAGTVKSEIQSEVVRIIHFLLDILVLPIGSTARELAGRSPPEARGREIAETSQLPADDSVAMELCNNDNEYDDDKCQVKLR